MIEEEIFQVPASLNRADGVQLLYPRLDLGNRKYRRLHTICFKLNLQAEHSISDCSFSRYSSFLPL